MKKKNIPEKVFTEAEDLITFEKTVEAAPLSLEDRVQEILLDRFSDLVGELSLFQLSKIISDGLDDTKVLDVGRVLSKIIRK